MTTAGLSLLGSGLTITDDGAPAADITVGSTTVTGGTASGILWNNAGLLGAGPATTDTSGGLSLPGAMTSTYTSLVSSPAESLTGSWFTGGTATTTRPHMVIEPTGTTSTSWNTAGTALGINAASGFVGNLIDFKVNNTSQVLYDTNVSSFKAANASGYGAQLRYLGISTRSTGYIGWAATDSADGTIDTFQYRDAANTIAQRNSTTAQVSRIYNTFTDASNYERASLGWSGNVFTLKPEAAGTGTSRSLVVSDGGGNTLTMGTPNILNNAGTSGATVFRVSSGALTSAAVLFTQLQPTINQGTTNAYTVLDINPTETATGSGSKFLINGRIGAGSSVFSVSNIGDVTGAGNLSGANLSVNAGGYLNFSARSLIKSSADGLIELFNQAGTSFTRLNFGGTTSSFPAWSRSGTTLYARLADDSAAAPIRAQAVTVDGTATIITSAASLTNGAGVATGTLTTAPSAGNPTKWIGINDNGTTRYVPAW